VDALCKEISSYKAQGKRRLDTIYFGGGTPSLLSVSKMQKIVASIRDSFEISESAEITFEANPGTLTQEKAQGYKALGFNRVSMGLQSIHEKEMKKLGRIHNYQDFLVSFNLLREAGFDNINVDLMYGIPYQSKDSFKETLDAVIGLSPEHISAYGLILEEGTPLFSEIDVLPLPTQDEECDMYDVCRDLLKKSGYEHYEISNYAKPGKRSRHNMLYWNLTDYIGVGVAAHSYFEGERYSNTDNVSEYISLVKAGDNTRITSDVDAEFEYVMLKLRLSDGFSLSEYEERFGSSFTDGKEDIIRKFIEQGLMTLSDGRLALTERGFYLSNSILVEIL
jgi:oxygen-independent coproporphyrinogen-3 oxidase